LADDELRVTPNVQLSDDQLNGDAQAIDEHFILVHIVGGGELEADYVPHVHTERGDEDESHAGTLLHHGAIKVHRLVLLVNGRGQRLDLSPFHDEVG
jgi:hypothetical protein